MLAAALLAMLVTPSAAQSVEDAAPAMPPLPDAPPAPPRLAPAVGSPGTLLLRGDGVTDALDCTGRNVMIEGNGASYTLRGGCRSVTVQGRDNTVEVELEPGGRIAIAGDGDTVRYAPTQPGPPPVISVTGAASRVLARDSGQAR